MKNCRGLKLSMVIHNKNNQHHARTKVAMSKDEYYRDTASRLDTIIGGDTAHFLRLQRVNNEYNDLAQAVPVRQGFLTFYDDVKEYYGIKLAFDGDNISLDYAVVDEQKYTVFLLKFGQ